ncbi:hypothetical protein GCM10028801_06870 [Nocardioides maradonensis]
MTGSGADELPYDVDALMRVYTTALSAGYSSALSNMGLPLPLAFHNARHLVEAVMSDPIARNHAVDVAIARYLDDSTRMPPADQGVIPLHVKGCEP